MIRKFIYWWYKNKSDLYDIRYLTGLILLYVLTKFQPSTLLNYIYSIYLYSILLLRWFLKNKDKKIHIFNKIFLYIYNINASYVKDHIKPIIEKNADIVFWTLPIRKIENFSFLKKCLKKFGSFVVRNLSNTDVEDETRGLRGISKSAAE